ncbi:cysteine dioxygenase family protein [Thermomonospora umbrina]|uniref:Putative metal-dependent enzyme (Double-stranded beta helix superfamily) n=1 Tax=Thermomonospora umbrina TaxID=111806 RepID=A0A3D9SLU5_9ACTN|nr:cysteine dioxygenase family protein [Thermomonospora umbrina]REE96697.1 putative metal-dependent enzyme (double-stranded beta helix superfamily) [Thermomonospora umbrina]
MTRQPITPIDSPLRPGLDALVARLRPAARRRADPRTISQQVADMLVETKPSVDLLTAAERAGSPDGYTRHTLHTEATFSVSAVVWRPGQVTEIHDHLVWCAFMVLQGAETETLYDIDGDRLVEIGDRRRPAGSVSGVAPPDDIHRVRNTGDMVAITLHVYGTDLSNGTSVRRTYRPGDDR